jgi:hypothetical protein
MNRGRSIGDDLVPDQMSPRRRLGAHPLALAAVGAVSLTVFAAAGW